MLFHIFHDRHIVSEMPQAKSIWHTNSHCTPLQFQHPSHQLWLAAVASLWGIWKIWTLSENFNMTDCINSSNQIKLINRNGSGEKQFILQMISKYTSLNNLGKKNEFSISIRMRHCWIMPIDVLMQNHVQCKLFEENTDHQLFGYVGLVL